MNWPKLGARFIAALFPAAALYLSWWLRERAGELLAGIAFIVLCVNYFWIMRNLKKYED